MLFMHIARSGMHFEANVTKCAVVVFKNEKTLLMVNGFGETLNCHTLIIITS